jgi:SagB-type dehydrogenase family enzyme
MPPRLLPLGLRMTSVGRRGKAQLPAGEGWWRAVIGALDAGVSTESDLIDFSVDRAGLAGAAAVMNLLQDLHDEGALTQVVHDRGRCLAEYLGNVSVVPYADDNEVLCMSPHAFFHAAGAWTVVGTAARSSEVRVDGRVAKHLLDPQFAQGTWSVKEGVDWLRMSAPGHSPNSLHELISVLFSAGVFISVSSVSRLPDADTRMWDFHELLFHTRTTQGHGATRRQGKTYRYAGVVTPEPALRQHNWPHYVSLSPANHDSSVAYWDVVRRRRSPPVGCDDGEAIGLEDLAQFLSVFTVTGGPSEAGDGYEVTKRLYPGAGACYELDAFVLISQCQAVEPGLYYYDPGGHALHTVSGWGQELDGLAQNAAKATGRIGSAAALVLLAARFERIAWKYEGIAYALSLKNAGVLLQSMYLAAAATGLEVCALGSADAGLFSQAVGSEPFREPLVGELMIVGKRRDD